MRSRRRGGATGHITTRRRGPRASDGDGGRDPQAVPGLPARACRGDRRHAAQPGSGLVGRTAAGRALGREALELAVLASVRHQNTGYDELLMSGVDGATARDRVRHQVNAVLDQWRHG